MALSSCFLMSRPQSPDPMIWLSEETHEFGDIPATDVVDHVFEVKNVGAKPLEISRVQTSCGCTAAVMDSQMLKPGAKTRLKVTFDPRGRSGPQNRIVWIFSNDPKAAQKQIRVNANVALPQLPEVTPSPAQSSTALAPAPVPPPAVAPAPAAPAPEPAKK